MWFSPNHRINTGTCFEPIGRFKRSVSGGYGSAGGRARTPLSPVKLVHSKMSQNFPSTDTLSFGSYYVGMLRASNMRMQMSPGIGNQSGYVASV
jgi:hypothetical protein